MAKKKLGRIARPPAEEFKAGRKLLFVPLIFAPGKAEPDFLKLVEKYWRQAQEQVIRLADKLTKVSRVYHELVTSGGEEGVKAVEAMGSGSYRMVKTFLDKGAELQPIEDKDSLLEFMDWSRCLAIGLQSHRVFARVYESFLEIQKKRNEQINRRIDETLKGDEIGLLLMREGHQVQFPPDVQVFYIAPPSLDEIRRWLTDREAASQAKEEG